MDLLKSTFCQKTGTLINQHDSSDFGTACLVSVSAYCKLYLPIASVRQIAGINKRGTNALGMVEAASKLGFSTKGVKGDMDVLPKLPVPTIAHIIRNGLYHFVVIYKVSKKG